MARNIRDLLMNPSIIIKLFPNKHIFKDFSRSFFNSYVDFDENIIIFDKILDRYIIYNCT